MYSVYSNVGKEDRIDQGDVFIDIYFPSIDDRVSAVVITPTCDLVQEKAHFVKFIATVPFDFVVKIIADSVSIDSSYFEKHTQLTKKQYENFVKAFERNLKGDFLPRYYLLREYPLAFQACYLDFQQLFVVPTLQVYEEYLSNRVAKINTPWREQIVAQYSGYSMRVGTPEYAQDELDKLMVQTGLNIPGSS